MFLYRTYRIFYNLHSKFDYCVGVLRAFFFILTSSFRRLDQLRERRTDEDTGPECRSQECVSILASAEPCHTVSWRILHERLGSCHYASLSFVTFKFCENNLHANCQQIKNIQLISVIAENIIFLSHIFDIKWEQVLGATDDNLVDSLTTAEEEEGTFLSPLFI